MPGHEGQRIFSCLFAMLGPPVVPHIATALALDILAVSLDLSHDAVHSTDLRLVDDLSR
jgi:hypothetical protein